MRFDHSKATVRTVIVAVCILLLGASWAAAQQQVNLVAGPAMVNLPDGSSVPMWGYTCGALVSGSTATCAKSNPAAAGWSPVGRKVFAATMRAKRSGISAASCRPTRQPNECPIQMRFARGSVASQSAIASA